jgi:gliding motility-associated-like protein
MSVFGGSCTSPQNSCSSDTLSGFVDDQRDLNANFMSFSACVNMFTEGQANKMRATIAASRSGLVNGNTACMPPCGDNIRAGYTRDNWNPVAGNTVTFTSQYAGGTHYEWRVNGSLAGGDNPSLAYQFTDTGRYEVVLRAYNADRTCYASYTHYALVTCGVLASFYPDKRTIASRAPYLVDTILFRNRSFNAASYTWLIQHGENQPEQVVSTERDLAYAYLEPGNYRIRLVAANGSCRDTSDAFVHTVQDATMDGSVYAYSAECYQNTKVRLYVGVCNNGYDTIPSGVPISFYDANPSQPGARKLDSSFLLPASIVGRCCGPAYPVIIETGRVNVNEIWIVFNDRGTAVPVSLPNSGFTELEYRNNTNSLRGFRFTASVSPPTVTAQPGDTLQLRGAAGPGMVSRFSWSPLASLSCTDCVTTTHIATREDLRVKLIASSAFGCSDSAFAAIRVPPADDFTLTIDSTTCVAGDSVALHLTVCNQFRRGFIPAGLKLSFYDGDPAAGSRKLGTSFVFPAQLNSRCYTMNYRVPRGSNARIFGVVNDRGVLPYSLPNDTVMAEADYRNNVASIEHRSFQVDIIPASAILQPGDTLRLEAAAAGDPLERYAWGPSSVLSCTNCPSPLFTAVRADRQFTLVGINRYGCTDTAVMTVRVPPRDDLSIQVRSMECSGTDSIRVEFDLCNSYARAIMPEGLRVTFYDADPRTGGNLLGPAFTVPAGASLPCASFVHVIRATGPRTLYAVVNDGGTMPFALPNDTLLAETSYDNNIQATAYAPEQVRIVPADTAILRNTSMTLRIGSDIYQPSSLRWSSPDNLPLGCTNCQTPTVTATRNGKVEVSMLNRWGCTIRGEATVRMLAPDLTVELVRMACYSATTSRVWFRLCMNNNYDSVWRNIPVSFYDRDPAPGGAQKLGTTFITPAAQAGSCADFNLIIPTPASGIIWAGVNDLGGGVFPNRAVEETNYRNNTASTPVVPFRVIALPSDTAIYRNATVQLRSSASGGQLSRYNWDPPQYLSCSNCLDPIARVPYTNSFILTGQNEYECVSSDTVHIRMFTDGPVNIPNAFTPNADGLNDVFFIMASRDVELLKEFSIYDRFGQRVFQQRGVPPNDPRYGWNGSSRGESGGNNTFVYNVIVRFRDGREQQFRGTVTVIR